jgi:pSer/pThr/pTyr-binding forkhead associated (FHA) protein
MSKPGFQQFVVHFEPHENIFQEGDPGSTMFIVQSGKVRLYRTVENQKRELGYMEKGDFFGEKAILEGLARTLSAETVEECELIEINSTTFDKMIKSNIEIAIRLLRKLSIRLREAERKLADFYVASGNKVHPAQDSMKPAHKQHAAEAGGARLESEDQNIVFALNGRETMIGRHDPVTELHPDIDLTEADLKRSVSRQHARIIRQGDKYTLTEEIGALNGTFVNGNKMVAGQAQEIMQGDILKFGMVKLHFKV